MRKLHVRLFTCLLFLLALMLPLQLSMPSAHAETLTVGSYEPYTIIQEALDNATDGDTIYVRTGTYRERLIINKPITLVGEEGNTTILDAHRSGNVLNLTSGHITIKNLTITNATMHGIYAEQCSNLTIDSCRIINNTGCGVLLNASAYATIKHSDIQGNGGYGVLFIASATGNATQYNLVSNCTLSTNGFCGLRSTDVVQLGNVSSTRNTTIISCVFSENGRDGVQDHTTAAVSLSPHNGLVANTTIANCVFYSTYGYDIHVKGLAVDNNSFYHNTFVSPTDNVYDEGQNIWFNMNRSEGNYWVCFDQESEGAFDNDSDGIIDDPYAIPGGENQDLYPLSIPRGLYKPVADANGPYSAYANTDITFDASGSTDPDGTIVQYTWNLGNGIIKNEKIFTYAYSSTGSYNISVTVEDSHGLTDSDTTTVTISAPENALPIADVGGPYDGIVNMPFNLSGSGSTDSDGTIENYSWDFGDGDTGSGVTPTHTYANEGVFSVTVTVTDNLGAVDTDTTTVTVNPVANVPPVADAFGPYSGTVNVSLSLSGSRSTDSDGTITGYRWDWTNDGTYDTSWASSSSTSHIYASAGSFTVKLQVRDDDNATDTDTTKVTVSQQVPGETEEEAPTPPTANAGGPYYKMVGIFIQFDGSDSYDPDGSTLEYTWTFGDGTTSTLPMPTHSYAKEGNYTVTLVVTDDEDATNEDTTFAVVTKKPNSPPDIPTIVGTSSSGILIACVYDINASDMDGDMIQYIIAWGDETNDTLSPLLNNNTAFHASHTWSIGGIFLITAYATDENNATSPLQMLEVLIDVHGCGSLGFLIDKNGDGIYDVFYRKTTGKETPTEKNNDQYHIDINSDGQWDYTYDFSTDDITGYTQTDGGFVSLFSGGGIDPTFLLFLIGVICTLLIGALVALRVRRSVPNPKLFYMRERHDVPKEIETSSEQKQTLDSEDIPHQHEPEFIDELRQYMEQTKKGQ